MPTYRQTFTVRGVGEFPLDMLRYDTCWPQNSTDAGGIADSLWMRSQHRGPRTIHLQRRVTRKTDEPTRGRWESFLWVVTEVETLKF